MKDALTKKQKEIINHMTISLNAFGLWRKTGNNANGVVSGYAVVCDRADHKHRKCLCLQIIYIFLIEYEIQQFLFNFKLFRTIYYGKKNNVLQIEIDYYFFTEHNIRFLWF